MKVYTKQVLSIMLFSLFAPTLHAANVGEQLYQKHCNVCHGATQNGQKRLAPPIFAVKLHYLGVHDEPLTFTDAVSNWVKQPAADQSLMPMAIRHFGLMPTLKIKRYRNYPDC